MRRVRGNGLDSIRIAGVDGCPLGWLVASGTLMGNRIANVDVKAFPTFREVLTFAGHNAIVSVDMPIGLLDEPRPGGRDCEKAARKMLSGTRKSSVFSAPPRSALRAKRFEDVSGMTIQSFHLVKRIRDVDRALTPEKQRLVVESHPELVFALLSDGTLPPKREPAGFQHRMDILRQCVPRFTEDASALAETVGSAYLRK